MNSQKVQLKEKMSLLWWQVTFFEQAFLERVGNPKQH
jgi:hypothetical protein